VDQPDQVVRPSADAGVATHSRRRPTGVAPPLPKQIGSTGWVWLILMLVVAVAGCLWLRNDPGPLDRFDARITDAVISIRTGWLDTLARQAHTFGSRVGFAVLGVLLVGATAWFHRWRHLVIWVISLAIAGALLQGLELVSLRPRPFGVQQLATWEGYATPSIPIGAISILTMGLVFMLVVPGRPRLWAKLGAAAAIAITGALRIYLGVDHFTDVVFGAIVGVTIPLIAFRAFAPNDIFPISYGARGKSAHLDVTGRRGEAIRTALQDQLGFTVHGIKPVGLEGSGGSTPLKLTVTDEGGRERTIFAKLYAKSHVRADRWYKLGRTILYGRLEDEAPFQSVRRLVEYEDYAARLLLDVGIPTAKSYGIVEMTPEREYLLITEFFDGASEIGDADVDDDVIDQGLKVIRQLWDAGLAHRDIKPANLLVHEGQVRVIDVFFVQVRPSPWRQAVDLANMMLVLAVRSDAKRVYDRALQYFTPDEIAEAFAAARGVASPTQLRMVMKRDPRDLLQQFREMAPARRPIALQRWNVKRVILTLALVVGAFFAFNATANLLVPVYYHQLPGNADCGTSNVMILMAQSVPSATSIPCVASLPAGWTMGGMRIERGEGRFWLDSDRAGTRAVTVSLLPPDDCSVTGASEVPSDEPGMRRFERPDQLPPQLRSTRSYLFVGGCITYRFKFGSPETAALLFDADSALAFQARAELVETVRARNDLRLCGVGAFCPGRL
jgi:membrane-associated phospholipid phosphatase